MGCTYVPPAGGAILTVALYLGFPRRYSDTLNEGFESRINYRLEEKVNSFYHRPGSPGQGLVKWEELLEPAKVMR